MDTAALASTLVSMQAAGRDQQMALLAVKNANEMAQVAVDLLSQAAQAGKAQVPAGVGSMIDKAA